MTDAKQDGANLHAKTTATANAVLSTPPRYASFDTPACMKESFFMSLLVYPKTHCNMHSVRKSEMS